MPTRSTPLAQALPRWLPLLAAALWLAACTPHKPGPAPSQDTGSPMRNPVLHVEIPVSDLDRAIAFYGAVFGHRFERRQVDGYDMAFLPAAPDAPGAGIALARGDVYRPGKAGPVIYIDVADIAAVLDRAARHGGKTLYPVTNVGEAGLIAEIEDSEGNRIGLTAPAP